MSIYISTILLSVAFVSMLIFIAIAGTKYMLTTILGEIFSATSFVMMAAVVGDTKQLPVWLIVGTISVVILCCAGVFGMRFKDG